MRNLPKFVARLEWTAERRRRSLPASPVYIHPARFRDGGPPWLDDDTWSVACELPRALASEAPSALVTVGFQSGAAPHDRLRPGVSLWLYEGPECAARIEIIESTRPPGEAAWSRQVFSDVSRDGLGAELIDEADDVRLEVFRHDDAHAVVLTPYGAPVPPDIERWFTSLAAAELGPFEDGTPLPPRGEWRTGAA